MLADKLILLLVCVITAIGLFYFTPRNHLREAHIVFLFKQFLTWVLGLLVVQNGLIEYPVRVFAAATRSSFTFEYFVYPAICVIFVLRFPEENSRLLQIGWFLLFPTWMTILEVLIERHTNLIHYIHWAWYWTWITLFMTFSISRLYYLWFFKRKKPVSP